MRYLRRFLWFITTRLFWVIIISGALIVSFYLAMNTANIYILLQDGLDARAGVVLVQKEPYELTKFFGTEFLQNDQLLRVGMSEGSPYAHYDIRSYEHTMSLEWVWSWPWDQVGRATVVEDVPRIDGKVKAARRDEVIAARGEEAVDPPRWQRARYNVTLARVNGQWKISGMQMVEALNGP
ncbi:MAG: hypothetical protein FWD25_04550 [Clostridia bacterium]|nr:hypothetical protein [Clostridia bacterium]